MCYYISQITFLDNNLDDDRGPMVKVLIPIPFSTLGAAEAALSESLPFFEKHDSNPENAAAGHLFGQYAIGLFNSHEPESQVIYDNLYNSDDPTVKATVERLASDEFNEIAEGIAGSHYNLRTLPPKAEQDPLSKLFAVLALKDYEEHPDDPKYSYDTIMGTGANYVDPETGDTLPKPSNPNPTTPALVKHKAAKGVGKLTVRGEGE
jgi:hypothetical protein